MLLVSVEGKCDFQVLGLQEQKCTIVVFSRATGFTTRSDIGPARDANDVS